MGLHVRTIARLPITADRDYFIYVLDYGWEEPLEQTLRDNFDKIASFCSENKAVVAKGFPDSHFEDEVFSWHRVSGIDGEEILPAIMITKLHPSHFQSSFGHEETDAKDMDRLLLIPLKKVCKTSTDVVSLLESLMRDMKEGKELKQFQIAKTLSGRGHLADCMVLEPNFMGVGINLPEAFRFLQGKQS